MNTTKPSENIISSLKKGIGSLSVPITVADAAAKSGLSLLDAKSGLNYLTAEYRGSLSATMDGELLYGFPTGFSKPWEQRERMTELWRKFKKASLGVMKFVVRAWISIVMVAYVVIFALILLALTFSKSSDREDSSSLSGTLMFHALFRLVLDSLFWTFHPFSPFAIGHDDFYDRFGPRKKKTPFYEKVNRFFFGPEKKEIGEQELTKLALQEIRAQRGRIGLFDLMRVTGLSKDEADPFMAKLMLNYEGDVAVSNDGGIFYEFPAIRKSALSETVSSPAPIWYKREPIPPFTGNEASSNFLIAGLNGFNLLMSTVAISNSWTIEKLRYIFTMAKSHIPPELMPPPPEGTPLLLGWIPFIFSIALFLIPVVRGLGRGKLKQEINATNGKRGLLRAILSKLGLGGIKEDTLRQGWTEQAQTKVDEREFTREIIRLGGELELDERDAPVYRFKSLEAEIAALEQARRRASRSEAEVGEVIFNSAK